MTTLSAVSGIGERGQREREAARAVISRASEALLQLSHNIHSHPELAFEEHQAARWCVEALETGGLRIEQGVCDLATAFTATAGSGPLTVAICAEYDALPGIGHACGHNVIAASAVAAGLALAPLADDLNLTVTVLGTPAEEAGGGKILMLERGGFDGVNAALMVHPAPMELIQMPCLAIEQFEVHYEGKEAHASGFPELGINAADALTISQVAIGLLRQHAGGGNQVHGIVTLGGAAPNVIPAHTEAVYYVRSPTRAKLEEWLAKVKRCFEAGAIGTGTTLSYHDKGPAYSEFIADEAMARAYRRSAEAVGRVFPPAPERPMGGSTDMANVSLAIPAIHPMLGIDSLPAVNHQPEFAAACATAVADRAVLEGGLAMALTVIDLATDPDQVSRLLANSYLASRKPATPADPQPDGS